MKKDKNRKVMDVSFSEDVECYTLPYAVSILASRCYS